MAFSLLRAKEPGRLIEISKDGCRASVPMTNDGKHRYVFAKLSDELKIRVEYKMGKHNASGHSVTVSWNTIFVFRFH